MSKLTDFAEEGKISWIGDGSETVGGGSLEVVKYDEYGNHEQMTVKSNSTGTPFNVRCSHGFSPSTSEPMTFTFTVQIDGLDGNVSVGLVSQDEFKQGWKTKGMFYNGNVTNGSASLITGFGKYVQSGDVVRIVTKKTTTTTTTEGGRAPTDSLDVGFYMNDKYLGTAFSISDQNDWKDKTFYPCVHVSGTVTFTCAMLELPGLSAMSAFDKNVEKITPRSTFMGEWKIESMMDTTGSNVRLPTDKDIVVLISASSSSSSSSSNIPDKISVKVGNTMSGPIQVLSSSQDHSSMNVKIGPNLMSTMMMPPPELYVIEQALSKLLPTIERMVLSEEKQNVIMTTSDSSIRGESTLVPYKKMFKPLTTYSS